MEIQLPAEGILKMKSYTGWRYYRVPCECGCENQVNITFEIDDPNYEIVTCHVSSKVKTDYWTSFWEINYNEPWIVQGLKYIVNGIAVRAKLIWKILIHGYVEMESYTLLTEQQALNMAATMRVAVEDLKNENKSI
jgi:hypothetical protein